MLSKKTMRFIRERYGPDIIMLGQPSDLAEYEHTIAAFAGRGHV